VIIISATIVSVTIISVTIISVIIISTFGIRHFRNRRPVLWSRFYPSVAAEMQV
jgi:hypothetical protein